MIIHHSSSEDFRPKRLVYGNPSDKPTQAPPVAPTPQNPMGIPLAVVPATPETPSTPAKDPRIGMTPEQKEVYDKKVREALENSRKSYGELSKEIKDEVIRVIQNQDVKTQIEQLTTNMETYASGGWEKWNEKFGKSIGVTDPAEIMAKVKAFQRVLFADLGVTGDNSAMDDGKIGPYTLAAMAARAGKTVGINVPVSENNKALAEYVKKRVEEASPSVAVVPGLIDLEANGTNYFADLYLNTAQLTDGAIRVRTGEGENARDTYYKYIDGKWKWAGRDQYRLNDWKEIGEDLYKGNGEGEADANEMASALKKYQDEVLVYNGMQQDYAAEIMVYNTGDEYSLPNPVNEACVASIPAEWQNPNDYITTGPQLPITNTENLIATPVMTPPEAVAPNSTSPWLNPFTTEMPSSTPSAVASVSNPSEDNPS